MQHFVRKLSLRWMLHPSIDDANILSARHHDWPDFSLPSLSPSLSQSANEQLIAYVLTLDGPSSAPGGKGFYGAEPELGLSKDSLSPTAYGGRDFNIYK